MARRSDGESKFDVDSLLLALFVLSIFALAAVGAWSCLLQAAEAQEVQASPARTDGPIYDLPEDMRQEVVCDEHNREYLLLTTEQGGVFLMPYMNENGEQEIMPQA